MSLPLRHSPADVLRRVLIALGAGTSPSANGLWPIFATHEPSAPDNVITVFNTDGWRDGRSSIDGEVYYHPGVQVRVRATDEPTGYQKASDIRHLLAEGILRVAITFTTVSPNVQYLIHAVTQIGEVLGIGAESPASARQLFVINATMAFRRLT